MRRMWWMKSTNEMELKFDSVPQNEGFARVAVGAFFAQLDPTLEEIYDVKTAVSEAVTNSIIHGYGSEVCVDRHGSDARHASSTSDMGDTYDETSVDNKKYVSIRCKLSDSEIEIEVRDEGCGIEDIRQAMEPMFTTKSNMERAGMGFAFMEAFMDRVEVESKVGVGTTIRMRKSVIRGGEPL